MTILKYYDEMNKLVGQIKAKYNDGREIDFSSAADKVVELIQKQASQGKKLVFIGNGGSAAISSHMAIDFWRNGEIKATAFTDAPYLTCISNDFGYEQVYAKPVEVFAEPGDVLVAISSSGKSQNILNGAQAARQKGCLIITLSGFALDNLLFMIGDLNFYVPSSTYSQVEVIHHTICHYILELILDRKGK